MVVYIYVDATLSICPALSFPQFVHKFILYIWVFNASFQAVS